MCFWHLRFFFSNTEKNICLSFVQKHLCLLLGSACRASDAGQAGWSLFFPQTSSPLIISCTLSFILSSSHPWQVQRCALDSVKEQGADGSSAQSCLSTIRWDLFPSVIATDQFRVRSYLFKYSRQIFNLGKPKFQKFCFSCLCTCSPLKPWASELLSAQADSSQKLSHS